MPRPSRLPRPSRAIIEPARDRQGCLVKPGDTVTDHKGRRYVVKSVDERHVATMIGGAVIPAAELTLQAIGNGDVAAAMIKADNTARQDIADWLAMAQERAAYGAIMAGSVRRLCENVTRNPAATDADRAAVAAILATF